MIGTSVMPRLNFVLLIAALATTIHSANGQALCQTDDQCDFGYYCDEQFYTCYKCVTCDNFKQKGFCAKSNIECESASDCRDEYKFATDGRCIPASITPLVIVVIVTITVALVVVVAVAVHVLRRKNGMPTDINPENGPKSRSVRATAPPAPETRSPSGSPPPYNHNNFRGTFSPTKHDETKSTVPLLYPEAVRSADLLHTERVQRASLANPPCYVRCPDLPISVNPQSEEQPPPAPEDDIPHSQPHNTAAAVVQRQEQEPVESTQFIGQTQPTTPLPPLQISFNINNTNTSNLLSFQQQVQQNR